MAHSAPAPALHGAACATATPSRVRAVCCRMLRSPATDGSGSAPPAGSGEGAAPARQRAHFRNVLDAAVLCAPPGSAPPELALPSTSVDTVPSLLPQQHRDSAHHSSPAWAWLPRAGLAALTCCTWLWGALVQYCLPPEPEQRGGCQVLQLCSGVLESHTCCVRQCSKQRPLHLPWPATAQECRGRRLPRLSWAVRLRMRLLGGAALFSDWHS